jgi:hypothetical protein
MKITCVLTILFQSVALITANGQHIPQIKEKRTYEYNVASSQHFLSETFIYNKQGSLIEKRSSSRTYKYDENRTTEIGYYNQAKNKISFTKTSYDSLGFQIIEANYYAENGKDIIKSTKEVYLPKDKKIVEPSLYWVSALSFKHSFDGYNERLIAKREKEWNEKGRLTKHVFWQTVFYNNWVKKTSTKYALNAKTKKLDLVEKVEFSRYGLIKSHVKYRDNVPFTYKFENANGITYKAYDFWHDYSSILIGKITDTTFVLKGTNEKPLVVVKMQIIEKLDSSLWYQDASKVYFDTIKQAHFYEYDENGELSKTAIKQSDSMKVLQTLNWENDGSCIKKAYNPTTQKHTSTYFLGPSGEFLGFEKFDMKGNLTHSLKNQYEKNIRIGSIEKRYGTYTYGENLKYRYLERNDTLYHWQWKSTRGKPFVLMEYTVKFNPYGTSIEQEKYFLKYSYKYNDGYSPSCYKTEYHYNAENTCIGYSTFKGTDSSQLLPTHQVIYEFSNEKIDNAFELPNGLNISGWKPPYYLSTAKHYPTRSKTIKEWKDNQWQITFLANMQSANGTNEWRVEEMNKTTNQLELENYLKEGVDTLAKKLDTLAGYFKTKKYRVRYYKASKTIDTSFYYIQTHNEKGKVVKRVFYQYKDNELNKPKAVASTHYAYNAHGMIVSEIYRENGVLKRNLKFEYEYY